jgi:hypothetical protein
VFLGFLGFIVFFGFVGFIVFFGFVGFIVFFAFLGFFCFMREFAFVVVYGFIDLLPFAWRITVIPPYAFSTQTLQTAQTQKTG